MSVQDIKIETSYNNYEPIPPKNNPPVSNEKVEEIAKIHFDLETTPFYQAKNFKSTSALNVASYQKLTLDERASQLVKLGFPYSEEITKLILKKVKEYKNVICNQSNIQYPACFIGRVLKSSGKLKKEFACFIEVFNSKNIYFFGEYSENPKYYIDGGTFKKAYFFWNIKQPHLLARLITDLSQIRDRSNARDQSNALEIVQNEEEMLHRFSGSKGMPLLYASFSQSDVRHILIMKYYQTDLFKYVDANGVEKLSDQIKLHWAIKILETIEFLHSQGVIHRDIKAENLFLDEEGFVLGDFGLAFDFLKKGKILGLKGTLPFMPYEAFKAMEALCCDTGEAYQQIIESFSSSIDIWGAGCILKVLFTGCCLNWQKIKEPIKIAKVQRVLELMEEYQDQVIPESNKEALLVQRMLALDPAKRLTVKEALKELESILQSYSSSPTFTVAKQFK